MAAGGKLLPVQQVEMPFHPSARETHYVGGKNADRGRRFDHRLALMRGLPWIVPRFVVIARRGGEAFSNPVNRHRGQQVIPAETLLHLAAAIAPGAALLNDPRT